MVLNLTFIFTLIMSENQKRFDCLPTGLGIEYSCRGEPGNMARPPNMATVKEVTKEQQRTVDLLSPRQISSYMNQLVGKISADFAGLICTEEN